MTLGGRHSLRRRRVAHDHASAPPRRTGRTRVKHWSPGCAPQSVYSCGSSGRGSVSSAFGPAPRGKSPAGDVYAFNSLVPTDRGRRTRARYATCVCARAQCTQVQGECPSASVGQQRDAGDVVQCAQTRRGAGPAALSAAGARWQRRDVGSTAHASPATRGPQRRAADGDRAAGAQRGRRGTCGFSGARPTAAARQRRSVSDAAHVGPAARGRQQQHGGGAA